MSNPKMRILAAIFDFCHIGFIWVNSDYTYSNSSLSKTYIIYQLQRYILVRFSVFRGKCISAVDFGSPLFGGHTYSGVRGVRFLKFFL